MRRCRAWRFLDLKDLWQSPANRLEMPSSDSLANFHQASTRKTSNSVAQMHPNNNSSPKNCENLGHNLFIMFWHSDKATVQTATKNLPICTDVCVSFRSLIRLSDEARIARNGCCITFTSQIEVIHQFCVVHLKQGYELNILESYPPAVGVNIWRCGHTIDTAMPVLTLTRMHEKFSWFMLCQFSIRKTQVWRVSKAVGQKPCRKGAQNSVAVVGSFTFLGFF